MKTILSSLVLIFILGACSSDGKFESKNEFAKYFYPKDTIGKIYLYRDIAHGLDEQYQRVYSITDSEGDHIIVETYSADGRILEALNYNTDSLDIMDHMVVNRNGEKTKAELFKKQLIPMSYGETGYFASRFQGFLDSTLILKEIHRKASGKAFNFVVLGKNVQTIKMKDEIRMTNFNPFTKKETVLQGDAINYFAEGYGLVEWHTPDKKVHYRLEKVLTQEEWIKIITR